MAAEVGHYKTSFSGGGAANRVCKSHLVWTEDEMERVLLYLVSVRQMA